MLIGDRDASKNVAKRKPRKVRSTGATRVTADACGRASNADGYNRNHPLRPTKEIGGGGGRGNAPKGR